MISGNGKGYGSTQFETSVEQMDSICLSVFLSFSLSLSLSLEWITTATPKYFPIHSSGKVFSTLKLK